MADTPACKGTPGMGECPRGQPQPAMPKKKGNPSVPGRAPQKGPSSGLGKGRRVVRVLAQSTLLAAGIAVSQFSNPEIDPKFQMFDPTLLDRLQAPITRYHE